MIFKIFLAILLSLCFIDTSYAENDYKLKVASFPFKPLIFQDDDGLTKGLNADILNRVAQESGWEIDYVQGSWNDGLTQARAKKLDLMTSVMYTEERDEYLDYNKEAVFIVFGEVYALPDSGITDLFSLEGKKVAIMEGDLSGINFMKLANEFGINCDYLPLPSHNHVFEAVKENKAFAGVAPNIFGLINSMNYNLVRTSILFNPQPLYFAAPSGTNKQILDKIDQLLRAWKQDKTSFYYKSVNRWLVPHLEVDTIIPQWVKLILPIGAGLLLFFAIWSRSLLLVVKHKTKELTLYQGELEDKVKLRTSDLEKSRSDIVLQKKLLEKQNSELKLLYAKLKEESKQREIKDKIIFEQKKFADMGQMINAIAHQWRQPINALGLYIQNIAESVRLDDISNEEVEDFENTCMELILYLSHTIDDFHSFFKPGKEKENIEVIFEIIALLKLVNIQFGNKNISLKVSCKCEHKRYECSDFISYPECDYHKTKIIGYKGEFKQALINLIYNAVDSIQEQRQVSPETKGCVFINVKGEAQQLEVSVCDNGTGIPQDHISKIFDPYFTTKDEGKGTGIGLYMTKLVVEKHMNGSISCSNNEDGGACFKMLFPLVS